VVADVAGAADGLERRSRQLLRALLAAAAAFRAPAVPVDEAPDGTAMRILGLDGRRWVLVGACLRSGRAVYGSWQQREDGREPRLRLYVARGDRWGNRLDGATLEGIRETDEMVVGWHRILVNLSDRDRVGWVAYWSSD
jgi:hypothetical protein